MPITTYLTMTGFRFGPDIVLAYRPDEKPYTMSKITLSNPATVIEYALGAIRGSKEVNVEIKENEAFSQIFTAALRGVYIQFVSLYTEQYGGIMTRFAASGCFISNAQKGNTVKFTIRYTYVLA